MQSFQSNFPKPAMPIATIDFYHLLPWPWSWFRGHKVSTKQNLFFFKSLGWNLIWYWSNSSWISWFCFWVKLIESEEITTIWLTAPITNPKPTVDTHAYGLYGCWEKKSQTLTVWLYAGRHQVEGLLHRTSIALPLARGFSQSDRLFPSVQKNSHWYQCKNKILPA